MAKAQRTVVLRVTLDVPTGATLDDTLKYVRRRLDRLPIQDKDELFFKLETADSIRVALLETRTRYGS